MPYHFSFCRFGQEMNNKYQWQKKKKKKRSRYCLGTPSKLQKPSLPPEPPVHLVLPYLVFFSIALNTSLHYIHYLFIKFIIYCLSLLLECMSRKSTDLHFVHPGPDISQRPRIVPGTLCCPNKHLLRERMNQSDCPFLLGQNLWASPWEWH